MLGDTSEVVVCRQHDEFMADTKLREKCINRPELHSLLATLVSKSRGPDVVIAIGHNQGQCREAIHDLLLSLRTREPLQEFLQDQPGRHYTLARIERAFQGSNGCSIRRLISPQRQ